MVGVPDRVAMVAGATGLVGREILAVLLADHSYRSVHCVVRRPVAMHQPKLVVHVESFAKLPHLPQVDDVFIALGTAIAKAGSQAAFRAVDLDAVVALAHAAWVSGADKLRVVSAMGADPESSMSYNRVKGEMEHAVDAIDFNALVIARPSVLAGDREKIGERARTGERLSLSLMRVLKPLIPANYRAISAQDVATALVHAVKYTKSGTHRLLSGEMQGAVARAAHATHH